MPLGQSADTDDRLPEATGTLLAQPQKSPFMLSSLARPAGAGGGEGIKDFNHTPHTLLHWFLNLQRFSLAVSTSVSKGTNCFKSQVEPALKHSPRDPGHR